jgi:hypothetical protein
MPRTVAAIRRSSVTAFSGLIVPTPVAVALLTVLLAAGCSGAGEDVRVRLCKDIVAVRAGTAPVFERVDTHTRGYEHAQVRLTYSIDGVSGTASCFYDHDAVEDTADQLADPLAAYATSPYRVIIGTETLPRAVLAEAIGQAMLGQGRELIEQAGDMARRALTQ